MQINISIVLAPLIPHRASATAYTHAVRHDTVSQVVTRRTRGRNLSEENLPRPVGDDIGAGAVCCRDPVESLVMGTSALARLLIIEARRTNGSLAAVTSLVGEGTVALSLETQ